MVRKVIFWAHLVSGVLTGLVIFMMSLTGVLLTYEMQILDWADARTHDPLDITRAPLAVEAVLEAAARQAPNYEPTTLTLYSDPARPWLFGAGRGGPTQLLDPFTGRLLGAGDTRWHAFFATVTGWHRWFDAPRESRGFWRSLTGISNLVFLLLILSGLYLWLPKVMRWPALRMHLWFHDKSRTRAARDYNWHHVFGFWTAVPLAVVVATAVVFSYGWAASLLNVVFGETPPEPVPFAATAGLVQPGGEPALATLFAVAGAQVPGWRAVTLQLPAPESGELRFTVDRGTGRQPQHRVGVTVRRDSGSVLARDEFAHQAGGPRARQLVRYLHTGEALGLTGQSVAGFVSLTSLLMVWTGFALAWRRLISPLLRARRQPGADPQRGAAR